ncbi:MAG: sigma-70 family RNA polymerase sigma factor [Oscillospiraceae bacterium]|nr:sigma-70 family RNA polymerase sigma factor [Oscillospiraceae bacterium]
MTNEQLIELIQTGGNDNLLPVLWEQVRKLLEMLAGRYYIAYSDMCSRYGVTDSDLKQMTYNAYLGAVKAYDKNKGFKFTAYLNFQFKRAIRPLFCNNLLNDSKSFSTVITNENGGIELIEAIQDNDSYNSFETFENSSVTDIVRKAVEQLPDELKAVIHLRYYMGLSVKATGKTLKLPENEARSKERTALNILRKNTAIQKLAREHRQLGLL